MRACTCIHSRIDMHRPIHTHTAAGICIMSIRVMTFPVNNQTRIITERENAAHLTRSHSRAIMQSPVASIGTHKIGIRHT